MLCAPREPATLDARQMLSHRVDLADVGARAQQRSCHGLLVGEGQSFDRSNPVRRCPAGQQHQHQVVRSGAISELERLLGGCNPGGIGDRMAGLDDRDYFGRPAIALARHGDTGDLPRSHG